LETVFARSSHTDEMQLAADFASLSCETEHLALDGEMKNIGVVSMKHSTGSIALNDKGRTRHLTQHDVPMQ
jgi:hypothetical protein